MFHFSGMILEYMNKVKQIKLQNNSFSFGGMKSIKMKDSKCLNDSFLFWRNGIGKYQQILRPK